MPLAGRGNLGLPHFFYNEIETYVAKHALEFMFEFVIEEMVYHRPLDWKPFLLSILDRYRKMRQQKRLIQRPNHLRHKENFDFFCGQRSLRKMCEATLYLLMHQRPEDPIAVTAECFDMPDDIYKLLQKGTLLKRHALFVSNKEAYRIAFEKGLVMEEGEYKSLHRELLWFFKQWDLFADGFIVGMEFNKLVRVLGPKWSHLKMRDVDLNGDDRFDRLEYLIFMTDQVIPKDRDERAEYLHVLEQQVVGWPQTLERLVEKGYVKYTGCPFGEKLYTLFRLWDKDRDLYVDTKEVKVALADLGLDWLELMEKEGWEPHATGRLYNHFEFVELLFGMWGEEKAEQTVNRALQLLNERQLRGHGEDIGQLLNPDKNTAHLLELFDMWDANQSGYLEEDEVDTMLVDIGRQGGDYPLLRSKDTRRDGLINRIDFVAFMRELWREEDPRAAEQAVWAMRKKQAGTNVTGDVVLHCTRPNEVYRNLGELFDIWDADKNGSIQHKELAVALRDIGLEPENILQGSPNEAFDREEFCEFLRAMWSGGGEEMEMETANVALQALKERAQNKTKANLEETGAIESSVAAKIAPKAVNELLKELFSVWDSDNSGKIEIKELERLLKRLGGAFADLVVDGMPDWLMEQADLDGDATLDRDEFVAFLKGLWEDKSIEEAHKMLKRLRYGMMVVQTRLGRIKAKWAAAHPDGMDRAALEEVLVCCPEGAWAGLDLPPVPRAGKDPLILPVVDIMAAIKTFFNRNKDQDEVFPILEHLEHKVEHGLSLLEASSVDKAIYDVFNTMDTDLSGRMETKELQNLLDECGGGYGKGVMQLVDEDGSGFLDKLEFGKFITEFWGVEEEEEILELLKKLKATVVSMLDY